MTDQKNTEQLNLLDDLFPLIIPKHDEAHGIIVALLDYPHDREIRIVDLGCGFGGLTRSLLNTFPAAVMFALDANLEILHKMREKMGDSAQIVPLHRDLNSPAWSNDIEQATAVVSSFALDYLPPVRHRGVVEEAFALLEQNGRWVSCEFYRSSDARVNRIFHDLEIRYVRSSLEQGRVSSDQLDRLSASDLLRQEHHIITVEEKVQWLRDAGFVQVEVPWRFLNLAIVSGIKP